MTLARRISRAATRMLLPCALAGLAGCVTVPAGRTESTTVRVDYAPGSLSDAEALAQARERCGTAEVTKTSLPETLPSGLIRVTATCLASFNRSGTPVPNDI